MVTIAPPSVSSSTSSKDPVVGMRWEQRLRLDISLMKKDAAALRRKALEKTHVVRRAKLNAEADVLDARASVHYEENLPKRHSWTWFLFGWGEYKRGRMK